jgi:ubiquinone/menaquinone biosynthesis C-methylase UbiE
MKTTYRWPVPPGYSQEPVWTGHGFRVAGEQVPFLSYTVGTSGWTDELTTFHEDNAGSDHFIDRASRRHAVGEVRRRVRQNIPVILEVGCSSGFLLADLRKHFPDALVIGADYVSGPLAELAERLPTVPLLQFDLVDCPLADNSVDVVVLLNVLEHIENDAGAVRQIQRILKPGGAAVIEVPAGPHLFDVYDKVLMHYRRYSLSGLRRLLEGAGLSVVHASSLGAFLYPAFQLVKKKNKRFLSEPEDVQKQIVARAIRKTGRNRLFEGLMWLESCLSRMVPLPVGIRCLATCVKPLSEKGTGPLPLVGKTMTQDEK